MYYDKYFDVYTDKPFSYTTGHPALIYLFKVNNSNTRKRCEICWKLTIKTLERRQ